MKAFQILASFLILLTHAGPLAGQTAAASSESLKRDLEELAIELLQRPNGAELRDASMAPVYDALVRLSLRTGDPRYLAEVLRLGDLAGWQAGQTTEDGPGWNVAAVWERVAALDTEGTYRGPLIRERLKGPETIPEELGGIPPVPDPEVPEARTFLGLAMKLENAGTGHPVDDAMVLRFHKMAEALRTECGADGLWTHAFLSPKAGKTGPLTPTAIISLGNAIGIRLGILDRETTGSLLMQTRSTIARQRIDLNRYAPWEQAILLAAGAELYGLVQTDSPDIAELLRLAEDRYRADQKPRARAMFVPQRKDDLAWENDRVANRIYGPALADSTEDSGIDAWIKRVPYPILEKWYRRDLAGEQSYHEDAGEGYDGYKVGARRGCGGAGIWHEDTLLTSNVFERHAIYWTGPEEARFEAWYAYPNGIREHKSFRITMGTSFTEITSVFTADGQPVGGLSVAIGLSAQTAAGSTRDDLATGELDLDDTVGADILRAMVRWDPERHPGARASQKGAGKNAEALVILQTDRTGMLRYEVGHALVGRPHGED